MKSTKASSRYAQSLLDLAKEQGMMEQVKADMDLLSKTIAASHELGLLLQSPIVKTDAKQKALQKIFKSSVSDLSMHFIDLIAAKGREAMMENIARVYIELYKQYKGIVTAEVINVTALTEAQREALKKSLTASGKTIELKEKIDPAILGGVQVNVGDRRIDASIRRKLNELRIDITKQKFSAN